jgi:hypothetical protein
MLGHAHSGGLYTYNVYIYTLNIYIYIYIYTYIICMVWIWARLVWLFIARKTDIWVSCYCEKKNMAGDQLEKKRFGAALTWGECLAEVCVCACVCVAKCFFLLALKRSCFSPGELHVIRCVPLCKTTWTAHVSSRFCVCESMCGSCVLHAGIGVSSDRAHYLTYSAAGAWNS